MAYTYIDGTPLLKANSYSFHFMSFLCYETPVETASSYSTYVWAGVGTDAKGSVGWNDLSVTLACNGEIVEEMTADYRTADADENKRIVFISTSLAWDKKINPQNVSITATLYKSSLDGGNKSIATLPLVVPSLVPAFANVNGSIKRGALYVRQNGLWKPVKDGYVNVNGTWKKIKTT